MKVLAVGPAVVVPLEEVGYGGIAVALSSVLEVMVLGSSLVKPPQVYMLVGKCVTLPQVLVNCGSLGRVI